MQKGTPKKLNCSEMYIIPLNLACVCAKYLEEIFLVAGQSKGKPYQRLRYTDFIFLNLYSRLKCYKSQKLLFQSLAGIGIDGAVVEEDLAYALLEFIIIITFLNSRKYFLSNKTTKNNFKI